MDMKQALSGGIPRPGETPDACLERVRAASVRKTTPCGEGDLVWHVWGESEERKTPVVLLHGNFGSWPHWIRNIPAFAEKYVLYVPDLPGFGDSAPPPEPYSMDGIVEAVIKGIDALASPETRLHVAGFSYGSTVSGFTARALGARALSLCLCGGSRIAGMQDLPRDFRNWRKAESDEERLAAHRHNLGEAMFSGHGAVDDLAVAIQDWIAPRGRIKPREFLRPGDLVPALKDVVAPKITIWGTRDPYYPFLKSKWREAIVEGNVDLALQEVEGAGHWAIYEFHEEMNRRLLAWFAANDPK
ncbi:MAG: alpha/beta hydrolase [Rhodospirillales bacterium]